MNGLVHRFYMANEIRLKALGWTLCPETFAHQATATVFRSHLLHECPLDSLPSGLSSAQGLASAYLNAYLPPIETLPCLSATGELVTIRYDEPHTKSYSYVFAVSDDDRVFYTGPFKHESLHHIPLGASVPVAKLFGNNDIYDRRSP